MAFFPLPLLLFLLIKNEDFLFSVPNTEVSIPFSKPMAPNP